MRDNEQWMDCVHPILFMEDKLISFMFRFQSHWPAFPRKCGRKRATGRRGRIAVEVVVLCIAQTGKDVTSMIGVGIPMNVTWAVSRDSAIPGQVGKKTSGCFSGYHLLPRLIPQTTMLELAA